MAVMTTPQSDSILLEDKLLKAAPPAEKGAVNGSPEVNGHASPAEITPSGAAAPGHKEGTKVEHNKDAFAANQAASAGANGTEPANADASEFPAGDAPNNVSADSDMPDAPVASPAPAQIEATATATEPPAAPQAPSPQQSAASPLSSAVSPKTKEDVLMSDAPSQPEQPLPAEPAESTQDTAISDVPAATPATEAKDTAMSPANANGVATETLAASPSVPITADTSLSEPSQTTSKVARERDIDSEDEPVAKRAKIATTAEQVEVKVKAGPEPDRMDLDRVPAARQPSLYNADGKPKHLGDESLNSHPITSHMARGLRNVLAGVKKTKAGASFKLSVQELWPGLWAEYSARISNPIDIGTMEKKLRGELPGYGTLADFKADVQLLVQNSVTFNGAEHEVTALARNLKEQIFQRMASATAAEISKPEKKEPAKQHPTRHAESRSSQPASAASPQRPAKTATTQAPPKPAVDSTPFAIPANNNGVPLIRRDSTKADGRAKRPVKPAHSKDLVYDTKRKKKLSPELRFCEEVLNEIKKAKYYEYNNAFLQPVDPVALQIPTYHKIVRKPMDLGTMEKKLYSGDYTSAKEFEKDFDLIVKNCKLFNGEEHIVSLAVTELQKLFLKEFSKKDDWMAKNAPAAPPPSFHAASPAPKDESDDDDHDSEGDAALDPEIKAAQDRVATIQRRLQAEQQRVNDMINTGVEVVDVEIAQSVVAMLQKNFMTERGKLNQLLAQKPSKPKASKPKKPLGGSSKKSSGGGASASDARPIKKSGGTKKAPKRRIGALEKEVIAHGIAELEGQNLERAIEIIKKDTGQGENDSGELELDIEQLSEEALVKLYDLATKTFPDLKTAKEKTFAAAAPVAEPPAPKHKSATKSKKNKPMSKIEQERRIAQLNELRAQAGRQASGSQEPLESIEGNGNGNMSADQAQHHHVDSDDEESSEEE